MEKVAFFKYLSYHKNIKTVQQMQGIQELVVTMRSEVRGLALKT